MFICGPGPLFIVAAQLNQKTRRRASDSHQLSIGMFSSCTSANTHPVEVQIVFSVRRLFITPIFRVTWAGERGRGRGGRERKEEKNTLSTNWVRACDYYLVQLLWRWMRPKKSWQQHEGVTTPTPPPLALQPSARLCATVQLFRIERRVYYNSVTALQHKSEKIFPPIPRRRDEALRPWLRLRRLPERSSKVSA